MHIWKKLVTIQSLPKDLNLFIALMLLLIASRAFFCKSSVFANEANSLFRFFSYIDFPNTTPEDGSARSFFYRWECISKGLLSSSSKTDKKSFKYPLFDFVIWRYYWYFISSILDFDWIVSTYYAQFYSFRRRFMRVWVVICIPRSLLMSDSF